jgi:hypothetical protein
MASIAGTTYEWPGRDVTATRGDDGVLLLRPRELEVGPPAAAVCAPSAITVCAPNAITPAAATATKIANRLPIPCFPFV